MSGAKKICRLLHFSLSLLIRESLDVSQKSFSFLLKIFFFSQMELTTSHALFPYARLKMNTGTQLLHSSFHKKKILQQTAHWRRQSKVRQSLNTTMLYRGIGWRYIVATIYSATHRLSSLTVRAQDERMPSVYHRLVVTHSQSVSRCITV